MGVGVGEQGIHTGSGPSAVNSCRRRLRVALTEPSRLDWIESKLAHLEPALIERNDTVLRQQRKIESVAARQSSVANFGTLHLATF